MSENKKRYFSRSSSPEELVFPIDYSENDFIDTIKKTKGEDIYKKTKVKSHLTDTQWYIKFNNHLLFYDCDPSKIEESTAGIIKPIRTIPVEAYDLLSSFVCHSINEGSPSKAIEKPSMHNCIVNTFIDLHDKIQKGQIDNPFLTHTLYTDQSFSHTIANHLWHNEISTRHKQVIDLAKQCDISVQIEVLQECLQTLDKAISKLQNNINQNVRFPDSFSIDNTLLPLLSKLTECRERAPQIKQNLITYNLEDLNIQYQHSNSRATVSISIEEAFYSLTKKSRRDEELLEKTRNAYLYNLAKKIRSSDFETQINDLTSYLGIFSRSKSEIMELVQSGYKAYLKGIIDHIHFEPNHIYNSTDSDKKHNHLLEDLLESEIKPTIAKLSFKFNDVIRIISHLNSMKAYLEIDGYTSMADIISRTDAETRLILDASPEEMVSILENKKRNCEHVKEDAIFCCQLFCAMWNYAFEGSHLLPEYNSNVPTEQFIDIFLYSIHVNNTKIALTLLKNHRKAEHFFAYHTRHENSYTSLCAYKKLINNFGVILCSRIGMPYYTLIDFVTPLLDDLFCIVLANTGMNSIESLTDKILQLQQFYNNRNP